MVYSIIEIDTAHFFAFLLFTGNTIAKSNMVLI